MVLSSRASPNLGHSLFDLSTLRCEFLVACLMALSLGAAARSAYLNARFSLEHDLLFFHITACRDKATADRPFLLFEGQSHTYAETYQKVLRYGTWLRTHHGVREQDIVALDCQNSGTFVFLWFALCPGVRFPDLVRTEDSYTAMAILIYTSGTTGLPKPAICMPLYHSSASCLGVCSVLVAGTTAAIGRQSGATIIQYVDETCRYLTVSPPEIDPVSGENLDKKHRVRVAMGNGLWPDVWDRFKERFRIDTIFEFYAATEGAIGTWNLSRNSFGKGAIGLYGLLSKTVLGIRTATVRLGHETEIPWRNPQTGFCQRVKAGEAGEFIVMLPEDDASNLKVMRGVFRKGDAWFRSGDIMQWDGDGIKSENVSTSEEANVYGVQLPHHDSRAGCVAVVLSSSIPEKDLLASLAAHATGKLPRYAVPLFLPVVKEVGLQNTGTNKQQKNVLRQGSIDPAAVLGYSLFWLKDRTYMPFGDKEWRELNQGAVRL
ncbi:fatty acid transporter protein [Lasiosphaeria ovina]|uniref:Fatty acid transporter protein n=1 Tax=Lasiosphaeria ovina TaxID=92902 RepID=A0AAE0JXD7_9PEZI|nr:fatty acid transporter protein [Lasiosphaeria ovina]